MFASLRPQNLTNQIRTRISKRSGFIPLLFLFSFTINVGCSTLAGKGEKTVVGEQGSAEGQWRAKALVKNKQTGKSNTLNMEIVAKEPSKLRIELTGTLGVYLASIAVNDERLSYILPREKKFVTAPADSSAFRDLTPAKISSRDLIRILFDRQLPERDWNCEHSATNQPSSCRNRDGSLIVRWEDRKEGVRRLKIDSTSSELSMVIEEAKSNVEIGPDIFELKPPEGYKRETRTSVSSL